jgi:hypothetical protein
MPGVCPTHRPRSASRGCAARPRGQGAPPTRAPGAQVDSLFRINHTDPWVGGDPFRTSRTISLQNTRASGAAVHGRASDDPGRAAGGCARAPRMARRELASMRMRASGCRAMRMRRGNDPATGAAQCGQL